MNTTDYKGLRHELGAFRHHVSSFFSRITVKKEGRATGWGFGSDTVNVLSEFTETQEEERAMAARTYLRERLDAGLAWITGPREYGGAGLTPDHDAVYREVERAFELPDKDYTVVGTEILAPVLLSHGTEKAKISYLPAIHRGEQLVCQLFSEPDAGSDLAAVVTSALFDGTDWRVTGTKVWSSGASQADLGVILARTDSEVPRHRGLTMFLVDMHQEGIEVRPIRQMTGGSSFYEVWLDDVCIPGWHILGARETGWSVALEMLLLERAALGADRLPIGDYLARLLATAQQFGRIDSPQVRARLIDVLIKSRLLELTNGRLTTLSVDGIPGPEMAMLKLLLTQSLLAISEAASLLVGPRLVADSGAWGTYAWSQFVLGTPGMRIGGGTDEILKNLLAERVLNLPREPTSSVS